MEQKKQDILMTEGNIWRQVIFFSIPLIIGNVFQQLYNTVDSIVVGNYVGKEALAAVGSSGSLVNLIVGLFVGIATGAGVLIAQYYGGQKEEKLRWAVHTSITLSIIGGLILTIVGILFAPALLRLMGTPESVMSSSVLYLKIFFLGSVFNLVYNMGAGILRAVGDSKNPLYYLCVASVVNIVLDIVFVVVLHRGVEGVGIATVISQAVSCLCVMIKLMKSKGSFRIIPKQLKIDRRMAMRVIAYGVPTGIQNSIVSLSNVIVQANINSFGDSAMAGCGAYTKIDGFVMLPIVSFSMAIMTFVGQNIGAGKTDRVKKGIRVTNIISASYVLIMSIILFVFGENILSFFTKEANVINNGMIMLHILVPFYIFIAIVNVYCGAFRGAGKPFASMVMMVANLCGVRMVWIFAMMPVIHKLDTVLWGYPVSWITAIITVFIYSKKSNWINRYS
ncbi:MATE family efflux transporter [Velocimicrobium porci]|uniref:MATE family efflux transporter n=1 Tax=Velocimicrobium porci TaxID=2606634 RepID=A0A6L5XV32_9FIRM|nr:MATE family efflux transporter [Velocimicrobium porci]